MPEIIDLKVNMLESITQFFMEIRDAFDLYTKSVGKMTKITTKQIVDLESDDEVELGGEDMAEYLESIKKSDRLDILQSRIR